MGNFVTWFLNVIFSAKIFFCLFLPKRGEFVCAYIDGMCRLRWLLSRCWNEVLLRLGCWGCGRFFRSFPTSISVIRLGKWHQLLRALYSQFPHQQVLWQHESPIFFSLQAPKPELEASLEFPPFQTWNSRWLNFKSPFLDQNSIRIFF